jgi:hypothetical protein
MRFEGSLSNLLTPSANGGSASLPLNGTYLSPGLARVFGGPPAFEIKFLLDADRAAQIEDWAARNMTFDPHADPTRNNSYRIHTLYLDTPGRDMFRRVPGHVRHKFRVRRYGSEPVVYLERKSKTADRVAKRRSKVPADELTRLDEVTLDPAWPGFWFRRRLAFRRLRPAWRVSYDRVAHVGPGHNGLLRMTLDRRVSGGPADGWSIDELPAARPALAGTVIVELKYKAAMPAVFKALLVDLGLLPRQASKYRLGVVAWETANCIATALRAGEGNS